MTSSTEGLSQWTSRGIGNPCIRNRLGWEATDRETAVRFRETAGRPEEKARPTPLDLSEVNLLPR